MISAGLNLVWFVVFFWVMGNVVRAHTYNIDFSEREALWGGSFEMEWIQGLIHVQ